MIASILAVLMLAAAAAPDDDARSANGVAIPASARAAVFTVW